MGITFIEVTSKMERNSLNYKLYNLILVVQIIIFSIVSLLSKKADAQKGIITDTLSKFYIMATIGYGVGINDQYIISESDAGLDFRFTKTQRKSGSGMFANAVIGYQFMENLAFDVGFGYLYGFKNIVVNKQDRVDVPSGLVLIEHGNMFQIIPSVVYTASVGNFKPYIRNGVILGVPEIWGEGQDKSYNFLDSFSTVTNYKVIFSKNISIGVQSALGCSVSLPNNHVSLFAEASFNAISFTPQNASIYFETINGQDVLSSLPVAQKETVFKNSIADDYSLNPATMKQPLQSQKIQFGFGNVVFSAGIKVNLRNNSELEQKQYDKPYGYVRLGAGYGFATDGDYYYGYQKSSNSNVLTVFSGGQGVHYGLGGGYMLSSNIGFDLGLDYCSSSKLTYSFAPQAIYTHTIVYQTNTMGISGNMGQIIPSVVFATHISKFETYTRLGLIFGIGNLYIDTFVTDTSSKYVKWKFDGGLSIGFNSTLGVTYPINHKLYVFAEASFNEIYDAPLKGVLVQSDIDEADNLANYSYQGRNIIIKQSFSSTENTSDPNKPLIKYPFKYAFNSLSTNVGIRIRF